MNDAASAATLTGGLVLGLLVGDGTLSARQTIIRPAAAAGIPG